MPWSGSQTGPYPWNFSATFCINISRRKTSHAFAALGAIVQGALVHRHSDKFVGELGIEVTRELHGVSQRFIPVIERVLNAFAQCIAHAGHQLSAQAATD